MLCQNTPITLSKYSYHFVKIPLFLNAQEATKVAQTCSCKRKYGSLCCCIRTDGAKTASAITAKSRVITARGNILTIGFISFASRNNEVEQLDSRSGI